MKKSVVLLLAVFAAVQLIAMPVSNDTMDLIADNFLSTNGVDGQLAPVFDHALTNGDVLLARVYNLSPTGYLVITADTDLPPVLAYSFKNPYETILPDGSNLLDVLISTDLGDRIVGYSQPSREYHHARWEHLMESSAMDRPEQWPPAGSTETGGWIETQWNQGNPWNGMCPLDPLNGNRSLAGCPAIAMGQIVNYHKTLNGTRLDDTDDYHHTYGGRNYWIDDDWEENGFPSFPTLNTHLDTLEYKMMYYKNLNNDDMAALVFACGTAAYQVYSTSASGTFGVNQIVDAFNRFNFEGFELLDNDSEDLFERMSSNMMEGKPVHLAIVTPEWDAGHNIVVDGYNDTDHYHLNFGWGGNSDGWYTLFEYIPYNLTVVEGAVVDIQRIQAYAMFPDQIPMTAYVDSDIEFNMMNINEEAITIDDFIIHVDDSEEIIDVEGFSITPALPIEIQSAETIVCTLHIDWTDAAWDRLVCEYTLHAISAEFGNDIQLQVNYNSNDNAAETPNLQLSAYPNPFNPETTIQFSLAGDSPVELSIYDIRGRKVRTVVNEVMQMGEHRVAWDGTSDSGKNVASGIYLIRLNAEDQTTTCKSLLLK